MIIEYVWVDVNHVNKRGTSALWIACGIGHKKVAELLLTANADVNKANKKGRTPLWVASRSGHVEMVKMLLANDVCLHKNNLIYVQGYDI